MTSHPDVIQDRKLLEQGRALKSPDQSQLSQRAGLAARHIFAVVEHLSGARRIKPADHIESGRLASAVRPDQSVDRSRIHLEAEIVDRQQTAEAARQIPNLQNWFGVRRHKQPLCPLLGFLGRPVPRGPHRTGVCVAAPGRSSAMWSPSRRHRHAVIRLQRTRHRRVPDLFRILPRRSSSLARCRSQWSRPACVKRRQIGGTKEARIISRYPCGMRRCVRFDAHLPERVPRVYVMAGMACEVIEKRGRYGLIAVP